MPRSSVRTPSPSETDATTLLEAGDAALRAQDWEGARRHFGAAAARDGSARAWEGLGQACWWLQDAAQMFDARQRAYTAYSVAGARREAARVAISLGNDFVDFRGDMAVAQGWLRHAERLLEGLEDADAERAWLGVWEARMVSIAQGDFAAGLPLIERALELAERAGSAEVEVLARAVRGLSQVSAGEVRAGMAELDEATATALSGGIADTYTIGLTCCYLIAACERTRDWDRAGQWCEQLRTFCTERGLAPVLTNCRLQYAGVLMAHGELDESEVELRAALHDADIARPSLRGAIVARLGELARRRGRVDDARAYYADAANHGIALLGGAALDLDAGAVAEAEEKVERYMRRLRPEAELERAMGLEMLARVRIAAGRSDEARATLERLGHAAETLESTTLRAAWHAASGALAALGGDRRQAVAHYEDAADLYAELRLPFEESAIRNALGRLQEQPSASDKPAGPLTKRERDVLRLVADGNADREIAERLFLSEHTVHRHLSNIRTKLEVGSRSAAVAKALRDGLL